MFRSHKHLFILYSHFTGFKTEEKDSERKKDEEHNDKKQNNKKKHKQM